MIPRQLSPKILKQFHNRGIRPNAYFWSDRNINKIDLLIDDGGKLYPFEIKAGQQIKPDLFKGLRVFNQVSGNDPALSHLIYGGTAGYRHPEGMQIRPWTDLPQFE